MIVLVPEGVHAELHTLAAGAAPSARLLPYAEEPADAPVPGSREAVAVFRWLPADGMPACVRAEGPEVRWLHTASAGVDHVLTPPVLEKARSGALTVTDSGPAFAISIGEFVLAWMLSVAHRLPDLAEQQRTKTWRWLNQEELHGQTAGIVGLGPIGVGIAERLPREWACGRWACAAARAFAGGGRDTRPARMDWTAFCRVRLGDPGRGPDRRRPGR
jgi:phosphoglycerate dehydrogenase-like enzyme